jgi:hypothetical protein
MGVGTLADVIGLSTKRAPSARALGYDPAVWGRSPFNSSSSDQGYR